MYSGLFFISFIFFFSHDSPPDASSIQEVTDYDDAFGEDEPETDGEIFVAFADDVVSDTQTENDLKHLEGKHHMSLQQMKEALLNTVSISGVGKRIWYLQ